MRFTAVSPGEGCHETGRSRRGGPFRLYLVTVSACGSGGHGRHQVPSPAALAGDADRAASGALVDSAPYWCDLVPQEALSGVTGATSDLREVRNSMASKDRAICGARDREDYGRLVVEWDVTGGRNEVTSRMKDVAVDRPSPLPSRLGFGFGVRSPSNSTLPYLAAATFGCGSRDAWIDIFLRRVVGRDATADLTDLMRIAQKRFGEIHRCTPRAVPVGQTPDARSKCVRRASEEASLRPSGSPCRV